MVNVSHMVFQKISITRLYPAAQSGTGLISRTSFGFESNGKRFFDVKIPGKPRMEPGMTVVALLEKPDGWENGGLIGWINAALLHKPDSGRDGPNPRHG